MRIGCHLNISEDLLDKARDSGFTCIQYMPGGRLSYRCPDLQSKLQLLASKGLSVIFHAPLCCYMVSDKYYVVNGTLNYLVELDKEVRKFDSSNYYRVVLHAGSSLKRDKDLSAMINKFINSFLRLTTNLILCIENDVGSLNGNRVGSVSYLYNLCNLIDNERVRMCIDTNHSWGHEEEPFDVTNMNDWDSVIDRVSVIHYNCIPSICKRYQHKDRHSEYLLGDSGDSCKWLLELINRDYNVYYIVERNDIILSTEDMLWLKENSNVFNCSKI